MAQRSHNSTLPVALSPRVLALRLVNLSPPTASSDAKDTVTHWVPSRRRCALYTGDHARTVRWLEDLGGDVDARACFSVEALLEVLRRDEAYYVVVAPAGVPIRSRRALRAALIACDARILLAVAPCELPALAQDLLDAERLDALIDEDGAGLRTSLTTVRAVDAQLRIERTERLVPPKPAAPEQRLLEAVARHAQLQRVRTAAEIVDNDLTPTLHEALALGLGADGETADAKLMGEAARLAGAIKGMHSAELEPVGLADILQRTAALGARLLSVPTELSGLPDASLQTTAGGVLEELLGQHLALLAQDRGVVRLALGFDPIELRVGRLMLTSVHTRDAPIPCPVDADPLHRALMMHGGVHATQEIARRSLTLALTFPFECQ
jgi:hypothetical protein